MRSTLILASLALAAATPAGAATNLVKNGSFENGFSDWLVGTTGGGTNPVVIGYNVAAGYPTGAFGEPIKSNTIVSQSPDAVGTKVAYFSSDTANPHSLTQTVNLIAGQQYTAGFDYYAPQNGINNPFNATLGFLVNGSSVNFTAGSPSGTPGQTWINFTTTFTALMSGPQTLSFQFFGGGSTAADFAIDRVFISAVPEPATWAMMLIGFGFIGYSMRRQRRVRAVLAAA